MVVYNALSIYNHKSNRKLTKYYLILLYSYNYYIEYTVPFTTNVYFLYHDKVLLLSITVVLAMDNFGLIINEKVKIYGI